MKKQNFLTITFIFLVVFVFTNCDQKAAQSSYDIFNLNENVEIKIGKKAKLNGGDLVVEFSDVTEDSRCPENVNCIQAGQVTAKLMANDKSLSLTKEGKQKGGISGKVGDYSIEMIEVNPYPKDGIKTTKEDYSITLNVTKS
mgnify:CR=1 FL=1